MEQGLAPSDRGAGYDQSRRREIWTTALVRRGGKRLLAPFEILCSLCDAEVAARYQNREAKKVTKW